MNGEWVVKIDNQIVARGRKLKILLEKVRKEYPNKTPYVEHIPKRLPEALIF